MISPHEFHRSGKPFILVKNVKSKGSHKPEKSKSFHDGSIPSHTPDFLPKFYSPDSKLYIPF